MKIWIGTKYITPYGNGEIPHKDCNKPCDTCFLWYAGWRVRLWKFLGIKLLVWSQDGKSINK